MTYGITFIRRLLSDDTMCGSHGVSAIVSENKKEEIG